MARRLPPIAALDHAHVWHPFTQMRDWLRSEPIVLIRGRGTVLEDALKRRYLDANSSIWTNLHGHRHPRLDAAITRQLSKVAHTSALGLASEPSARLAAELVAAAAHVPPKPTPGATGLTKVFFSDDGSTAVETALKLAYEFTRRTRGPKPGPRFLSMEGAYHGDTVGAVSVGHIDLFHKAYGGLLFKAGKIASPYCYRCPFNRAQPERADARTYRKCQWECVREVEATFARAQRSGRPFSAFIYEPRIQGAAGMIAQPEGWLPRVASAARAHGALLVADEVMTGFARTGGPSLFAGHSEGVVPDLMALAKGLTGGYLPLAATLATQPIFDAFLGEYSEFRTFFHGHSYTGNALGCAVARENLALLRPAGAKRRREHLANLLSAELASLWSLPAVGDIRQVGLVAGIELVQDFQRRTPFPLAARVGMRVCEAMARRGVLTRPIGNVLVLMPPYCTRPDELRTMVSAMREAIEEITEPQAHAQTTSDHRRIR
jgi:adenosylmethionine---8-amino-7-oxononanoate aminotransferase